MTVHEPDQTRQEPAPDFGSMLLRVAWLAILLGLGMEVLLLVLGGAVGDVLGVGPIVADFVRNITWSVFVCVGLAVGTAVAKARVPIMGALGLVFGSVEIALASTVAPLPPVPDLLVEGVNEVLFPVGCALVLFSANVLGK